MLALIKIFIAFFIIILLMKAKLHLGIAMLLGSLAMGLFFGLLPEKILAVFISTCGEKSTLELIAIVILILALSNLLESSGQMSRLLDSFSGIIRDARASMAILPMLIGLLPMPGGALFSAPMVEKASKNLKLGSAQKVMINYWFRHIWEYCWPLYPGIILAAQLTEIDLPRLSLHQFPLTIVAVMLGIFLILSPVKISRADRLRESNTAKERVNNNFANLYRLLWDLLPIMLIIVFALFLSISLIIVLVLAIVLTFLMNRFKMKEMALAIKKSLSWKMVALVIGVMTFKSFLEETQAITSLTLFFEEYHISPLLLITMLPFLMGIFTGITIGVVGTAFPLLLPFFFNNGQASISLVVLAFTSGFVGVLLSPVHFCLLFTCDYFKVKLSAIYGRLILPAFLIFLTGIVLFVLYKF